MKLSQLRSKSTNARETKQLVHDITTIVGVEALAEGLEVVQDGNVSDLASTSKVAAMADATLQRPVC